VDPQLGAVARGSRCGVIQRHRLGARRSKRLARGASSGSPTATGRAYLRL